MEASAPRLRARAPSKGYGFPLKGSLRVSLKWIPE